MNVRKPSGELNRKTLDGISRNWFVKSKNLKKIIKKGDKDHLRKLNEKRANEIKKAEKEKNFAKRDKIKKQLKDEKAKYQSDASKASQELNEMKAQIRGLLNR